MGDLMYKLFTPVDELRRSEPEYFRSNKDDIAITDSRTDSGMAPQKNPVMILDEGVKKIYGMAATYTFVADGPLQNPEFTTQCRIRDLEATGKAKTKKIAKQIASAAVLKQLIRKHLRYGSDLGIPHSSVEEADEYIDAALEQVVGAKPVESAADFPSDFERDKNYVGLLQEIVQKSGANVIYEDEEERAGVDLVFTVEKLEFEGKAKKKKEAKARAAYLMFKHLQESMNSLEKDLDEVSIDDTTSEVETSSCPSTINPDQSLADILNDKSKVSAYEMDYTHDEPTNGLGFRRCLLKVQLTKAGETETTKHVFFGLGCTQEEAEKQAALNALLLYETY